jgi:hypothetical protein
MNRAKRPDTWPHRPMLQNVKKILANPEPSTHDPKADQCSKVRGSRRIAELVLCRDRIFSRARRAYKMTKAILEVEEFGHRHI